MPMLFNDYETARSLGKPIRLFIFSGTNFGPYAYTDGETSITKEGQIYKPWPIKASEIEFTGTLDKDDITINMALGDGIESEFLGSPPDTIVNLRIFEGHESLLTTEFKTIWLGRITSPEFAGSEMVFTCQPASSTLQKVGLRRNWQRSCPHALYGPQCKANKVAATINRTITTISGNQFIVNAAIPRAKDYRSGLAYWEYDAVKSSLRTILDVDLATRRIIRIRGNMRGLMVGATVSLSLGCNLEEENCIRLHNNILNFGGQKFIPLENPLSSKNQFF